MDKERLIHNMADQIMEAQLKLGYVRESIRLYYPVASLNAILKTRYTDVHAMREALAEAFKEPGDFGKIKFRVHAGRLEIGIPPEGAEYVHRQMETPAFLEDIILLFQTRPGCSLEEIRGVFGRYSERYVCEKMPEGSDFDYVLYFEDPAIDEYYYCVRMEMGHTIYHRFVKEDYMELL